MVVSHHGSSKYLNLVFFRWLLFSTLLDCPQCKTPRHLFPHTLFFFICFISYRLLVIVYEYVGDIIKRFHLLEKAEPELTLKLLSNVEKGRTWLQEAIQLLNINQIESSNNYQHRFLMISDHQACQAEELHELTQSMRFTPHVMEWLKTGNIPTFGRSSPHSQFLIKLFKLNEQEQQLIHQHSPELLKYLNFGGNAQGCVAFLGTMNKTPWFQKQMKWVFQKRAIGNNGLLIFEELKVVAYSQINQIEFHELHPLLKEPNNTNFRHLAYPRLQWAWIFFRLLVENLNIFDDLIPEQQASLERCIDIMTLK